jgi:PPOX class probable FMN-dependent enzyme
VSQITTLARLIGIIPDPSAIAAAKVLDHLDEQALDYIARSPFLIMATESEAGLDLSPKGDDPGFVHVLDNKTLLVPERNGNQLKMGLRNILANGRIGLMFFRPATGDVLRVVGHAELFDDADLCERLTSHSKPALLAIRVAVERAFFHCPRAILRAQLWKPESWDAPSPVKMGQIYAKAHGRPEIADYIDKIGEERNNELWI